MPENWASVRAVEKMDMDCQEFRELIESYLSNELLVETNHGFLRHLEKCAACRTELAARRELRLHLRSAVRNAAEMQTDPLFVRRLQSSLRETALNSAGWERFRFAGIFNPRIWVLTAACLFVVLLFGVDWLRRSTQGDDTALKDVGQPDHTSEKPLPAGSPLLDAVHIAWREIEHAAVSDHRDCALAFRLEEKPISLQKAAEKFGRLYKDLDNTVDAALKAAKVDKPTEETELVEAHSCVFQGRRFAHVVLRRRNHLVSILVTNTDLPFENSEGISTRSEGGMQTASFGIAHNAVFVVSDLSEAENMAIARMVSPSIRRHIQEAEV